MISSTSTEFMYMICQINDWAELPGSVQQIDFILEAVILPTLWVYQIVFGSSEYLNSSDVCCSYTNSNFVTYFQ